MIKSEKTLYLLPRFPVPSETFIQRDLKQLLACSEDIIPAAVFAEENQEILSLKTAPGKIATGSSRRIPWMRGRMRELLTSRKTHALLKQLEQCVPLTSIKAVHCEFADLALPLAAMAAKKYSIPYSIGCHASDIFHYKYSRRLLKNASFITVCNQCAESALIEMIPECRQRIHMIRHGINLEEWPFSEHRFSENRPMHLLFAGRLVPKKGLAVLSEITAELQSMEFPFHLTIAGSGPEEANLRSALRHLPPEQFCFKGFVAEKQLKHLIGGADLLLVPSVQAGNDSDGVPNIIVEAMASGLAVLGSDAGGLPELLSEKTGFVFHQKNVRQACARIKEILNTPHIAREKARAARQKVEADFDIRKTIPSRLALFAKV